MLIIARTAVVFSFTDLIPAKFLRRELEDVHPVRLFLAQVSVNGLNLAFLKQYGLHNLHSTYEQLVSIVWYTRLSCNLTFCLQAFRSIQYSVIQLKHQISYGMVFGDILWL